jgi:ubiquinone/menaquinone biosynthesis C-methylase UbiE
MPPKPDEQAVRERFDELYQLVQAPIMREIERSVCGCDYGGTSWTTRREAEQVGELLGLAPGRRLLEVGAGSGWPGLYLARTTGCDVTLLDLPLAGLRIGAERAVADRLPGACWSVLADGAAMPFGNGAFDAVSHSDVLCCLDAKLSVLRACRRVIRSGGRMVFTVIFPKPGLSSADHERAVESGPPFVETALAYPAMLRQAGWVITDHVDLTAEYAETVRRLLRKEEAHADELSGLYGEAEYSEKVARRHKKLRALEAGLLWRELFAATTAPFSGTCGARPRARIAPGGR